MSKGWKYDPVSDNFKTSDLNLKFACNCGAEFHPAGFEKCRCGRSYASFEISSQDKTAAKTVRVVRPVKEHRERILARVASLQKINSSVTDPLQAAKNADYIAYLERRAKFASDNDAPKTERDDDPDYQSADSSNQEPSHKDSLEVNNEFSQGIKPTRDQSNPYFVRTNHSDDLAPVVLDKSSSLTLPVFVRR